tara:strand:- start:1081 stop:2028 length:948 start_codon:yes stop_codon:yes gene_type:complete
MLPYKIIKDSATYGLRFEQSYLELERALEDDTPTSSLMQEDTLQQDPKNSTSYQQWKKHEDDLLEEAVRKNGKCTWSQISDMVPGKTGKQCCDRWRVHLKGATGRNVWGKQDDAALEKAVHELGHNWTLVARAVTGKTNRQCRDRYKNYVDPSLNKSSYTKEEDEFIMASANLGHGWAKIAGSLVGRTDANIKLRFNQLRRKSKTERKGTKPEKCHVKYSRVLNTDDFFDHDVMQSLMVQCQQPLRTNNNTHAFTLRIVKKIKHNDNLNLISTRLNSLGKVHANNFQTINKRIRERICGNRAKKFDLLCHETGVL